jgi:hypothetical protein
MKILSQLSSGKTKEAKDTHEPVMACTHHDNARGKEWRNIVLTHDAVMIVGPKTRIKIPIDELLALEPKP